MHDDGLARMWARVSTGDTEPNRVSLQNKPEMPDISGRQDVPASYIPERGDKEIHAVSASIAAEWAGTESNPPAVALQKRVDDRGPVTTPNTDVIGNVARDDLDRTTFWTRYCPEGGPIGILNDYVEFPEPVHWPEDDLIHSVWRWEDADHLGMGGVIHLHWTDA